MRRLTKTEWQRLYAAGFLGNLVDMADRVIAQNVQGQAFTPLGYEVVYCLKTESIRTTLIDRLKRLIGK